MHGRSALDDVEHVERGQRAEAHLAATDHHRPDRFGVRVARVQARVEHALREPVGAVDAARLETMLKADRGE